MAELSYAVVFVTDMNRSIAFYRNVFGLAIRHQSHKWTEFATPGVTLALQQRDAPPSGACAVSMAGQPRHLCPRDDFSCLARPVVSAAWQAPFCARLSSGSRTGGC